MVAVLGQRDVFGEGCLVAQPRRIATASAMSASTVLVVEKPQMLEMLHTQPAVAERFLAHMLARNIRVEEDLVDQLFNSSEAARARYTRQLLTRRPARLDRLRHFATGSVAVGFPAG